MKFRQIFVCLSSLIIATTIACKQADSSSGGGVGGEKLVVNAMSKAVIVQQSVEVVAMFHAGNGIVNVSDKVIWHIEPPNRARVIRSGLVQGLEGGEFRVWAELDELKSNKIVVEALHVPPPN